MSLGVSIFDAEPPAGILLRRSDLRQHIETVDA
jgi:hypothetical protein